MMEMAPVIMAVRCPRATERSSEVGPVDGKPAKYEKTFPSLRSEVMQPKKRLLTFESLKFRTHLEHWTAVPRSPVDLRLTIALGRQLGSADEFAN